MINSWLSWFNWRNLFYRGRSLENLYGTTPFASGAVWPDGEIKRSPNLTVSSLNNSHNNFYLKGLVLQSSPNCQCIFGQLWWKNVTQNLQKSPTSGHTDREQLVYNSNGRAAHQSLSLDRLEFTYLRSERYFANQSSRKSFCCLRLVQTRVIICMRNLHQLGTFLLTAVSYALYLLILAYIGVHWFTLYKLHLFYAHVWTSL